MFLLLIACSGDHAERQVVPDPAAVAAVTGTRQKAEELAHPGAVEDNRSRQAAEQDVAAGTVRTPDSDDRLTALPVETVRGDGLLGTGHERLRGYAEVFRSHPGFGPLSGPPGGKHKGFG